MQQAKQCSNNYRSIMELVMDGESFKSDNILRQTSKIAEIDSIEKFNSLCKPTKNNELTEERSELTYNLQIIFREFQTINNKKKEEAKQLLCTEARNFCQSYSHRFIAETEYPLISDQRWQTLYAEITLNLTEAFKQTHLDSPLIDFGLQYLTQQLNKKRLSVYQGMKSEYKNVLHSANAVSAQALDCYKHRTKESSCCNFYELSELHNTAKTAAIGVLKKSNLIHPKMLQELLFSLESEIDSIYIQIICYLDIKNSRARIKSTFLENAFSSTYPSSLAIGIDFGTSFCRVAVLRHPHGDPEILKSDFLLSTPSYVSFVPNQEKGENAYLQVFAGEQAKQLASVNPENSVSDIKRLIGKIFNEREAQTYNQLWPFHLINVTGNVGVRISKEEKLPQVIASELLRHLKTTSEDFLRSPIDCAVVTIPVHYSEIQKGLTEWACHAAGFKYIHFIAEPVAAAVAYGIKSSLQSHEAKTCLIYNLGGGTFNVTVFRMDAKNRVEVKAIGGDDRLGGEDFNDLLTEFCINEFNRIHGVNLAEGKTSDDAGACKQTARKLHRIRNECEVQKCYLSSSPMTSVEVSLDYIYEDANLEVKVTRAKFEELLQSLLDKSIKILDKTLMTSGCKKEEIDDVILIGGSSRIPKVQQMVQEYFVGQQIRSTIAADTSVACGAAVHAYNVFKENGAPFSRVTLLQETQSQPQSLEFASSLELPAASSQLKLKKIRWGTKINGFPPREQHAAVAVGSSIYSFGGDSYSGDPTHSEDVLDVFVLNVMEREKKWKPIAKPVLPLFSSTPNQRRGHSAVAHMEFVVIFGGFDTNKKKRSNSTYRYNILTLKWDKPKVTGNVPGARLYHSAVVVRNEMIIYGGSGRGATNDLHSLHLESFCWTTIETKGIPPSLRRGHSATVHEDRFILIFGGHDYDERKAVNIIHSFDLNNKTWTAVETRGTPPSSRMHHCAFVHEGQMYISGGSDTNFLKDIFSYDPETCEWKEVTPTGEAPTAREFARCVALNGQVFIFAGWNLNEGYLDDTNVIHL